MKDRNQVSRFTTSLLTAALAVAGSLVGCGGTNDAIPKAQTYEVKGKVTLADGKPLKEGRITFEPDEPTGLKASGKIGTDGTYALSTRGENDGAVPGKYSVKVDAAPKQIAGKITKLPERPFDKKYSDESTSGLKATVEAKPNEFNFQLK